MADETEPRLLDDTILLWKAKKGELDSLKSKRKPSQADNDKIDRLESELAQIELSIRSKGGEVPPS